MASSEMMSSGGLAPRGSPALEAPLLMPSLLLMLPLGLELRGEALGEDGCSPAGGGGSCSCGRAWWRWAGPSEELSEYDDVEDEDEEEALDGEEGQEKVVGEEEEARGGGAGGREGPRWSGRRTGDKDASVSAIVDERDCEERERF